MNNDQQALKTLNPEREVIHGNDLPMIPAKQEEWMGGPKQIFDEAEKVVSDTNNSVESAKKSLEQQYLLLHQQLGHIHESMMQLMVKQGTLQKKYNGTRLPFCASCAYGKSIRKSWRSKTSNNREEAWRPTKPGECISVDQLISPTPGIIAKMTAFAGVGAHHQNGVVERRISLLQDMTKNVLIHAQNKWTQVISANLWPYALSEANSSWNCIPSPRYASKLSPE